MYCSHINQLLIYYRYSNYNIQPQRPLLIYFCGTPIIPLQTKHFKPLSKPSQNVTNVTTFFIRHSRLLGRKNNESVLLLCPNLLPKVALISFPIFFTSTSTSKYSTSKKCPGAQVFMIWRCGSQCPG